METIASRIIDVCNIKSNGNMSAFAREIGVTPAYISKLKNEPDRVPSDRTIADICEKFGVNEIWLRTGVGEPFTPLSRSEELAAVFANVQLADDDKSRLIRAMARMPDEAFPAFVKFIEQLHATLSEE